eukprot:3849455-Prymnesium_polylepis.1
MDKDKLSYSKKKLNDNDCKTLYNMLIPPRESKSAKKAGREEKASCEKKASRRGEKASCQGEGNCK